MMGSSSSTQAMNAGPGSFGAVKQPAVSRGRPRPSYLAEKTVSFVRPGIPPALAGSNTIRPPGGRYRGWTRSACGPFSPLTGMNRTLCFCCRVQ
jgi:hypothetical protein